jgi:2-methylcitrate dehydratase PrpD
LRSVTSILADYASGTTLGAIPAEIRERTKKVIFDELACAYFGRRSTAGTLCARYATSFGGPREAHILGTSLRAPATYAALANGTASHGEEVDGTHVIGGHPGASIVHACMAVAERQCATGEELINAVVLGYDIGVRIVRACGGKFTVRDRLHTNSDSFFSFGIAAAVARLLGLDSARHAHAFALASFQSNGLFALFAEERHISKSLCIGMYGFAGISASLMAAAGLEGNRDIFGCQHGVLDAWGAPSRRQTELTDGLGANFEIEGHNFKFINAGMPIHTPIEASLTLLRENSIALEAIEKIEVGMTENPLRVVDNNPMHNICVQDMLAASIVRDGLALHDMPFPTILDEPDYRKVRDRISVSVDSQIQSEMPEARAARVTITTTDGQSHTQRIDHPRGHSRRGDVSWGDLYGKWQGNLFGCDVDSAFSAVQALEKVEDVQLLSKAFAGIMR